MHEISIKRYNPEMLDRTWWESFQIPVIANNTILGALLYIKENIDPSLAFRFSCRFKNCGLCAVMVDGIPKMACRTKVGHKMRIEPLYGLKPIRDLVVDREEITGLFRANGIYPDGDIDVDAPVIEGETGARLRRCLECFACLPTCETGKTCHGFAGPVIFVRLAQLYLDPRNRTNRREQAKALGIGYCASCEKKTCYCINGIDIERDAISVLL